MPGSGRPPSDPGGQGGEGGELGFEPVRLLAWVALFTTVLIQLVGLYSASPPGPELDVPQFDKVGHVVAFAVPTAIAAWLRSRWFVLALGIHALISELIQGFLTDTRLMDPFDTVANVAGVAVGLLLARVVLRRSAMMES